MDNLSLLDRFNNWIKESVMIKLLSIGVLTLILMIPGSLVQDLIYEREARAEGVFTEVADKWAAAQTITGPILRVPFKKIETVKEWTNGVEHSRVVETLHYGYFLPNDLTINGQIAPEVLHRGIFDVSVYDSKINMNATFGDVSFDKWDIPDQQVLWADAVLVMGITDLRGIHEDPKITSNGTSFISESTSNTGIVSNETATGILVPFEWKSKDDVLKSFSVELNLKGSDHLYFMPSGKTTSVALAGNWASPSFEGSMLPTTRNITETNFDAAWKIPSFNRAFSDTWMDNDQAMSGT